MNLTLCDKKLSGDVPTYQVETEMELDNLIEYWLSTKNFSKSVFVCFETYTDESVKYENENPTLLISSRWDDIRDFWENIFLTGEYIEDKDILTSGINFSIFEFESFKEAFLYCIDLKEGL